MSARTTSLETDLGRLLQAIAGERAVGEFLRYEGTYDRIREARREDDPGLSRGIYETSLKRADWKQSALLCIDALENRTKDLQIAAWLLEAWLHLYGFAGVHDGLRLLSGLCENFWDNLYPEIEPGDPEHRIAPIIWINEKLSLELKKIAITAPQTTDAPVYSYADWESACHLDNLAKRRPDVAHSAELSGQPTPASFHASASLSPSYFYAALSEELNDSLKACLALEQMLDEKCGKNSPSLHQFKEVLISIQHLVTDILRSRQDGSYELEEYREESFETETEERGNEIWSSCPIRSRAEAYWRLSEAADYLLRTEPHSPTPYLVKRAVAWGSMSLFELFQQIIRNEGEMEEINRLLRLANKDG
ncbi:MAG: type VI secretion system protein TssA [Pyrinomonadaceae bacterium]|nr:type VI secretion system protein TssA [Pyrinomonadaceae bacterium]